MFSLFKKKREIYFLKENRVLSISLTKSADSDSRQGILSNPPNGSFLVFPFSLSSSIQKAIPFFLASALQSQSHLFRSLCLSIQSMDCLVSPAVSILRRRSSGNSRLMSYRPLYDDDDDGARLPEIRPVTVVVGKEKRQFLVDPFVLDEDPFRVLLDRDLSEKENRRRKKRKREKEREEEVIFIDVDSILFEHMLWLVQNDSPSLLELNLEEIIDFYAQDY